MQYISIAYAKKCILNIQEPEKNPSITKGKLLSDSLQPHGLYSPWNSTGQNTGVGSLSLLQGIFPTQGLNPGLTHCRGVIDQLRHKGSPRILEWVAYSFSSRSSQPRSGTGVSCIAGRFFTSWAIREARITQRYYTIINCIPHTVHFITVTHLFCNWKFVPLNIPPLFLPSPYLPPLRQPSDYSLTHDCVSVLLFLFLGFVF